MSSARQPDIRLVDIASIDVPPRLRPIDPDWVSAIASSMTAGGEPPAIVCNCPGAMRVPDFPDRVVLVAGAHRLAAAKQAGRRQIAAELIAVDEWRARLIEIDENLLRRELSALDRAIFLAERQSVWERLHPATRRGVAGGLARQNSATDMLSFADEAAERTGLNARTIQRAVALIRDLDEAAREAIRAMPIADNGAQLAALARLAPDAQRAAATAIAAGRARTVAEAVVGRRMNRNGDDAAFAALLKAWSRAGAKARRRFLAEIGATVARPAAPPPEAGGDA
jgi:ParB family chromosome partitioning protein